MIKTLTGLLLTLTLLNPVANADPFSTTWEWVEEHPDIGVPALTKNVKVINILFIFFTSILI
jgi:hypothetical protein